MWPDRRLKQKVQPVDKIDENIEKIWSDLIDTMEITKNIIILLNGG